MTLGPPPRHTDGRTDDKVAYDEWAAAWLKPNEDFILETDRVLNEIAWAKLTSVAQDAGGANDRWEQSA